MSHGPSASGGAVPKAAEATHGHEPYVPVFTAGSAARKTLDDLLTRYPTKVAALLPALWMVQEARGWISEAGDGRGRARCSGSPPPT